jgi:hypothetical protein
MRIIFRYAAMQDVVDFALATLRDRRSATSRDLEAACGQPRSCSFGTVSSY